MSKVMVSQVHDLDDEKKGISRNDKIGFSCLNYMVMENCGSFEVKITKKVNEDFVFLLKTVEASAKAGKKFKAVDEMITLSKSQSEYSLKIEIIDDGPGLPEGIKDDIFDPFVSGKENGTGLGLALVSKIISDHGGWISVSSVPGRTIFRISLPRCKEQTFKQTINSLTLIVRSAPQH